MRFSEFVADSQPLAAGCDDKIRVNAFDGSGYLMISYVWDAKHSVVTVMKT